MCSIISDSRTEEKPKEGRRGDVEKEKETKKEGKKCFKLVWRGKEGSGQVEISRWGEMSL